MSLFRNRMFKAPSYFRLPDEYQRVEYLESSGSKTPYLDIGRVSTLSDTNFKIKFQALEYRNYRWLWGSRNGGQFQLFGSGGPLNYVFGQWNDGVHGILSKPFDTNIHTLKVVTGGSTLDGVSINRWLSGAENVGTTFYLFSCYGYHYDDQLPCRIFYFLYKEAGKYIKYMVPCYHKSDNKPGMYDLKNDIFYTNQREGGTDFILGPEINNQVFLY